jgi:hypothetical protein
MRRPAGATLVAFVSVEFGNIAQIWSQWIAVAMAVFSLISFIVGTVSVEGAISHLRYSCRGKMNV